MTARGTVSARAAPEPTEPRGGSAHRARGDTLGRAALAGLAGTTALAVFESTVERAMLGRAPPYAVARVVQGLPAGAAAKALAALALRYGYGLSLAVAYGFARGRLPRSPPASGLLMAAVIYAGERLTLPRLPGLRPFGRWSVREKTLLAAHTAVYGVVVAVVFDALRARTVEPASAPLGRDR